MRASGTSCTAKFGGWFWVDATAERPEGWVYLESDEGVRQGAPLSCFLAGLGGRRAQLAAEAAIDEQHGVSRHAGATEAEQAWSFSAAARGSGGAPGVTRARPRPPTLGIYM